MSNRTRSVIARMGEVLRLEYDRARLLVQAGPSRGYEIELAERAILIGRAEDMDLRLDDPAVSRAHAVVEPTGKGWNVRDLGSRSGTFLDGVQVEVAPLQAGSRVRIGESELELRFGRDQLLAEAHSGGPFEGLVGECTPMRELFGLVRQVGSLDLPVLVAGESGVGKEGLARAVHRAGIRASGPYEVVDCTLLEREHMRSELFGHVKGAFTGADSNREGAFGRADGGTLFLDEIAELPLELQPAFLRVLEQGEVRPLGGDGPRRVRVRVVSATNRDLAAEVAAGNFREDLYFRLSAVTLAIPPLRARGDDRLLLARHFLGGALGLAEDASQLIQEYSWPGNVRELRFKLERAAALARGGLVRAADLGIDLGARPLPPPPTTDSEARRGAVPPGPATGGGSLADLEQQAIRQALALYDGNKSLVAQHLGIGRSTLYRRLREYGIPG